jgi:hypothetical protein
MGQIATTDAQALFTKKLGDFFVERIKPMSFLRSFYVEKETPAKEISLEVQRGSERVAADVVRGTDGNRNTWSRSTEKLFIPPYFREFFDITQLQLYDRLYGATEINDRMFSQLINDAAERLDQLKDKIDRAIERYCAGVFDDGIVRFQAARGIDYKRKPASMVTLTGDDLWTVSTGNPFTQIAAWCQWMRKVGKVQTHEFNLIMGDTAHAAFMANSNVLTRQNLFNMSLDRIAVPQKNSVGGVFHGTITCDVYRVNIWSYPDFYEDDNQVMQPYWNPKKVFMLPTVGANLKLWYAAVPQLLEDNTPPQVGKFIVNEYIDRKAKTREVHLESAPLPVPVTIDQIFTAQVTA